MKNNLLQIRDICQISHDCKKDKKGTFLWFSKKLLDIKDINGFYNKFDSLSIDRHWLTMTCYLTQIKEELKTLTVFNLADLIKNFVNYFFVEFDMAVSKIKK